MFILLRLPDKAAAVILLIPLLLDARFCLLQGLNHAGPGDRLEQVLIHMQFDRLLRIGKIIIAGEDDDFRSRQFLADKAAERQAVHERHLDVRNQNVRLDLSHQRQRHFPVGGFPGKDETVLLPRDHIPQPFPYQALVFCQKNFKH